MDMILEKYLVNEVVVDLNNIQFGLSLVLPVL